MTRRLAPAFLREIRRTLFLTRQQTDVFYGRLRAGFLGYLFRRLWRPFDLVVRFFR